MKLERIIIITLSAITITSCGPDPKVEECVNKGIAYFKEIGSYPTLKSAPNTGRKAEDVARERCNRITTAFP